MGRGAKQDGVAVCFDQLSSAYRKGERTSRTMPIHDLFFDNFDYSFEDLCCINDFRINIGTVGKCCKFPNEFIANVLNIL